ncbi:hypothetical protein B0H10DRAFT_2335488 [Mycena sp. CBHHK59/15]|nr:hypothetical protein B0H10DRAFT_2335488 [Mycena sp. CBHHK59/15]
MVGEGAATAGGGAADAQPAGGDTAMAESTIIGRRRWAAAALRLFLSLLPPPQCSLPSLSQASTPITTGIFSIFGAHYPGVFPLCQIYSYLQIPKSLIPHHLGDLRSNNIRHFNNTSISSARLEAADTRGDFDPFATKVDGLTDTNNNLVGHKLDPFKHMLTEDFQKGWEALMSVDPWSMRDWLALPVDDSQRAYPEPVRQFYPSSLLSESS